MRIRHLIIMLLLLAWLAAFDTVMEANRFSLIYLLQKINQLPQSRKASEWSHLCTSAGGNRACPKLLESCSLFQFFPQLAGSMGMGRGWFKLNKIGYIPELSIVNILYFLLKLKCHVELFFFKCSAKWNGLTKIICIFPPPFLKRLHEVIPHRLFWLS